MEFLYSAKKHARIANSGASMALSRLGKKTPIRVMHFTTFRCNLRCKYCGIWDTYAKEMNTNQVKHAIKEFASAGALQWVLTGGEPLLRKDIGQIIDYAKDFGLIVNLTTNGILLKSRLEEIRNASYLVVSLDGPKDINDSVRGIGCFDKTIDGINAAMKKNMEVVINATLSKANISNGFYGIKELMRTATDLGARINFSVMYKDSFNTRSAASRKATNSIFPSSEETNRALDFIKSYKKKHRRFVMFTDPVIEQLKRMRNWNPCYAGRLFCDMFPDGTVAPCLFKKDESIDGLKTGFLEAFKRLPAHSACVCPSTCYNELNMTFSMNPRSLADNFVKYLILT